MLFEIVHAAAPGSNPESWWSLISMPSIVRILFVSLLCHQSSASTRGRSHECLTQTILDKTLEAGHRSCSNGCWISGCTAFCLAICFSFDIFFCGSKAVVLFEIMHDAAPGSNPKSWHKQWWMKLWRWETEHMSSKWLVDWRWQCFLLFWFIFLSLSLSAEANKSWCLRLCMLWKMFVHLHAQMRRHVFLSCPSRWQLFTSIIVVTLKQSLTQNQKTVSTQWQWKQTVPTPCMHDACDRHDEKEHLWFGMLDFKSAENGTKHCHLVLFVIWL